MWIDLVRAGRDGDEMITIDDVNEAHRAREILRTALLSSLSKIVELPEEIKSLLDAEQTLTHTFRNRLTQYNVQQQEQHS